MTISSGDMLPPRFLKLQEVDGHKLHTISLLPTIYIYTHKELKHYVYYLLSNKRRTLCQLLTCNCFKDGIQSVSLRRRINEKTPRLFKVRTLSLEQSSVPTPARVQYYETRNDELHLESSFALYIQ